MTQTKCIPEWRNYYPWSPIWCPFLMRRLHCSSYNLERLPLHEVICEDIVQTVWTGRTWTQASFVAIDRTQTLDMTVITKVAHLFCSVPVMLECKLLLELILWEVDLMRSCMIWWELILWEVDLVGSCMIWWELILWEVDPVGVDLGSWFCVSWSHGSWFLIGVDLSWVVVTRTTSALCDTCVYIRTAVA